MSQVLINESTLQDVADGARGLSKTINGVYPLGTKVVGKLVSTTSSSIKFEDQFPNFDAPYIFICYLSSSYLNQNPKYYTSEDGNSKPAGIRETSMMPIVIPYKGLNKTGYHYLTQSGYNGSVTHKLVLILLDENFNPIIYNNTLHQGLPYYTFQNYNYKFNYYYTCMIPYIYKKEDKTLLYPSEFKKNIQTTNILQHPLPLILIRADAQERYNCMDMRLLGIEKLEDLKMLQTSGYMAIINQQHAVLRPGFESFGVGYRCLKKFYPKGAATGDSASYDPFYNGNLSLHMKDHRLYLIDPDAEIYSTYGMFYVSTQITFTPDYNRGFIYY